LKKEESLASIKVKMAFCWKYPSVLSLATYSKSGFQHPETSQFYWRSAGQRLVVEEQGSDTFEWGAAGYSLTEHHPRRLFELHKMRRHLVIV